MDTETLGELKKRARFASNLPCSARPKEWRHAAKLQANLASACREMGQEVEAAEAEKESLRCSLRSKKIVDLRSLDLGIWAEGEKISETEYNERKKIMAEKTAKATKAKTPKRAGKAPTRKNDLATNTAVTTALTEIGPATISQLVEATGIDRKLVIASAKAMHERGGIGKAGSKYSIGKVESKRKAKAKTNGDAPSRGVTGTRPVGETSGLSVTKAWCHIFEKNEKVPKAKKLEDTAIAKWMEDEFPGRKSAVFNRVNSVRNSYNKGKLTKSVVPEIISQRFDASGAVIAGRTRKATATV